MIVFIRTDLTFVNPTLYILKHRVVSANAYLPEGRVLVAGSPFVVVCRDPRALASSNVVDVTSIAGGFVTKDEPKVGKGREQQKRAADERRRSECERTRGKNGERLGWRDLRGCSSDGERGVDSVLTV